MAGAAAVAAGTVAAILGGLAIYRHVNTTVKPGDYVAFPLAALGAPIQIPGQPPNTEVVLRVDTVTPQGLQGYAVGYLDQAGNIALPGGGAAGVQIPVPVPRKAVTAIYRSKGGTLKRAA